MAWPLLNLVNRLLRHAGYREVLPTEIDLVERLEAAGCGERYISGQIISDRQIQR